MKFLILIGLFLISFTASSQVWVEDFSAGSDGDTNGAAAGTIGGTWSVTTTPSGGGGTFARLNVGAPYGGIFMVNQTVNEGAWSSNVINISALGDVAIEGILGGNNATAADYVHAFYKIDGGPEILFGQATGTAGTTVFTASSAVVSGTTLQIVIRGKDNSGGGGLMGFDDITVTDVSVLYSIASTNWNNGATWSTTGFGGVACTCTPDIDTKVIIGNGKIVNFTADGTASGVEIQNTGTLRWVGANNDLTISRGAALNVQLGGVLTRNANAGSSIIFGNYTYPITVAGTLEIGLFDFNSSSNSTIDNSGTLTLTTSPIGLDINGTNGYAITNTGTFNLTGMNLANGNLTVDNSGIINQTGNFSTVDAGSAFNNLSGGTWNFSGTTITNVRLFANNNSNTFNYSLAGPQSIITPQDAYSNLTLSGSGAKSALASFSVKGDWTRSGTATFTPGAFTVTLNGTIAQTIAAVGSETFANLTINNTFATSPQIILSNPVTVSTVLTMTDGNIDLNGNAFTISSSAAGALSHTMASTKGWMYGGSITRSFPATAIAAGNVAGFFPMGTISDFRPFFVDKTNVVSSNGTITLSYTDANTATDVNFLDGATPIQRRHDAFWSLTKTAMTAGVFNISAGGTGFTIGAVNQTHLTRVADAAGIGTFAASSGTTTDIRVRRTTLTPAQLVNNFYLASTNAVASPLPILLEYYRADIDGDVVKSTWKTLQEKNNHFFTVQRTTDFETFYEVGILEGEGNSSEEHTYALIDDSPFFGKSYYRLKQTDFDGKFAFSDPVMINYDGPVYPLLKAYPNPNKGNQITVEIKGLKDIHSVPVQIYNQQGQKVMDIILNENEPGVMKEDISFPVSLPAGLYIIKAGRTKQLTQKIAVY